jgi:hypothetical protein
MREGQRIVCFFKFKFFEHTEHMLNSETIIKKRYALDLRKVVRHIIFGLIMSSFVILWSHVLWFITCYVHTCMCVSGAIFIRKFIHKRVLGVYI